MSQERRRENRRLREASKSRFSRRAFYSGGAVLSGALALTAAEEYFFGWIGKAYNGVFQEKRVSFEEARRGAEKRPEHIKGLAAKLGFDKLSYVDGIVYVESIVNAQKEIRGPPNSKIAMVTESRPTEMGKKGSFKITVYPFAYDTIYTQNENDFISSLWHEVSGHAKLQSEGFPDVGFKREDFSHKDDKEKMAGVFIDSILELYAYRDEISEAPRRNVSRPYYLNLLRAYLFYYSNIMDPYKEEHLLKNPEALKRFRIYYFGPIFMDMDMEHTETGYKGPVIMQDGRMMTYYGPRELDQELKERVQQWRKAGQ